MKHAIVEEEKIAMDQVTNLNEVSLGPTLREVVKSRHAFIPAECVII